MHGLAAGGGKVNAKDCGGGDVLGANATRSGRVAVFGDWDDTFVSGGQKGERDGNLAGSGAGESAEQPIATAAAGEGALVAEGVVEAVGVAPDGRHVVEDGEFGRAVELRGRSYQESNGSGLSAMTAMAAWWARVVSRRWS